MENFKGTPGEWVLIKDGEANFFGFNFFGIHNKWLMRVQQNGELHAGEQEANAKLISAAPDLLEALQDMLLIDELDEFSKHKTQMKAINAINKATL